MAVSEGISITSKNKTKPAQVGVIMGSRSDQEWLQPACELLDELKIAYEVNVVSAHRTPLWMADYAQSAKGRGSRTNEVMALKTTTRSKKSARAKK